MDVIKTRLQLDKTKQYTGKCKSIALPVGLEALYSCDAGVQ